MADLILIVVLVAILGATVWYLYKKKKSGKGGCGSCGGCSGCAHTGTCTKTSSACENEEK